MTSLCGFFSPALLLFLFIPTITSLSAPLLNRRNAVLAIGGATANFADKIRLANAEEGKIDMEALNAIRFKKEAANANPVTKNTIKPTDVEKVDMSKINAIRSSNTFATRNLKSVIPISDPSPNLSITGSKGTVLKMPRVGYSLYKTPAEEVVRGTSLALRAGVKHFDVGGLYDTNDEVAKTLRQYLNIGITGLDLSSENLELLKFLDATRDIGEQHGFGSSLSSISSPIDGSAGRSTRRSKVFIHYKLSNSQQSTDSLTVKRIVKKAMNDFGTYFDMVSLHSPLTSPTKRLTTYATLLELRNTGFIKSVGVCNYGVGALKELQSNNLELPSLNQLELSPFNTHSDIIEFCSDNKIVLSCAAWSKLSSTQPLEKGWDSIVKIANAKGMTKAQVLVRWAIQKGYACVPRSATMSALERKSIAENSYGGVNTAPDGSFVLTDQEMQKLDSLNLDFKAGALKRRDGWNDSDVTGTKWDPTNFV